MPAKKRLSKKHLLALILLIVISVIFLSRNKISAPSEITDDTHTDASQTSPPTQQVKTFDKTKLSLDDPASLWVVANKKRPLRPTTYVPADLVVPGIPLRSSSASNEMLLRAPAARALEAMATSAKKESINIMLASGYRSYNLQVAVYGNYVKTQGRAVADTQSARPGFSEHQTGLAADIEPANRSCEVEDCFANTPEGKWVAANAYKFGFIIRYQATTSSVVGYKYEPWHLRFVGEDLSNELQRLGNPPLETFFGLPAAADYN